MNDNPTPMETEVTEIQELKLDRERLDWILTEDGHLWLYDRNEHGQTTTRQDIDIARYR